jgi:hypothetical protein
MDYKEKPDLPYCKPECSQKAGIFPGEDCAIECKVAWNNLVHRSVLIKEVIENYAMAASANSGKQWIIKVESLYTTEDIVSL